MSTSAYNLNARQHPRTTLFSSTVPSPPPGLFRSTLPAPPPGLPIHNSVAAPRTGMQSPPRFVAARAQSQSQSRPQPQAQTNAVRRGSQEKVVPAQVSRQEVIRQTEPVRIGEEEEEGTSLDDLLMSNLSPSTELNRAVAFSVAESALEGDSEDDGIDIDHRIRMLERRMTNSSVPKPTTLSAAAPTFQFNPKVTLPWEEAEAKKVGMDVLSYQRKQMHVSQGVVFRPAEPMSSIKIDTSSLDEEKPRKTLSHSRSRSDIPSIAAKANNEFVLNTPIQPSGSFAAPEPEKDVQTEQEAIALLPPPRCITPLPFKRPSFAEAMLMPGFKSGMPPTLAEISARYKAGRARSSTSGSGSDKENNANADDWPARPKRYSLDSTDSMSEQSFGENGSTSTSGPSLPATPRKSRLPAFLQHARTNSTGSSGSDDVILYSPTKSISFMDELCNQVPQTPESTYPVLKVTPPSVENVLKPKSALKTKSGGPMQVMLEDGEDCSMSTFGGEVNKHANGLMSLDTLSSLPTITCTPATAPGIAVSPLAMLEAQVKQNQRAEKRQERAQIMLSTLQRRNRAPGVAA